MMFVALQGGQEMNPAFSLIMPLSIFAIFYFLLIRPQQKKQQDHKKFLESLEKNQEVVTAAGLHGTIVGIKGPVVTLRLADNLRIDVEKSSVSHLKSVAA